MAQTQTAAERIDDDDEQLPEKNIRKHDFFLHGGAHHKDYYQLDERSVPIRITFDEVKVYDNGKKWSLRRDGTLCATLTRDSRLPAVIASALDDLVEATE